MGYLTEKERYMIEAWYNNKVPVKVIASRLNRSPACIYNEIKRGSVKLLASDLRPVKRYCADVGQRLQREAAANKGIKKK